MTTPIQPDARLTYAPVDTSNMTQPTWAVLYYAEARTVWVTFTGPDAHYDAKNYAAETTMHTIKQVAVIGPQCEVYSPTPMKPDVYTFDENTPEMRLAEVSRITQAAVDAGRAYRVAVSKVDGWFRAVVTVYPVGAA